MPDLVGETIEVAKGILESSNLILGTITPVDDEAPEGVVIFQNIIAETEIAENTKVNLSISNGSRAPQSPESGENGEDWMDPEIPGDPTTESSEAPDNGAIAPNIG